MKRVVGFLMAASLMAPVAAMANSPTLDCPAGTVQVGGPSSAMEASFCAIRGTGTPHGPYVTFDKQGRVTAQGEYQNGFRAGTWQIFDGNGVKTDEIQFQNGDFHGRKVAFHANGRKKVEENYVQGRREGQLRKFDAAGDIVAVEEYRGNVMVKR